MILEQKVGGLSRRFLGEISCTRDGGQSLFLGRSETLENVGDSLRYTSFRGDARSKGGTGS